VDRYRRDLLALVEGSFAARESVQAILPFANTLKRPKGPEGKVRTGVYQGYRRYRPLLLTDRRLFIFETGRTPHGRGVLAEFSNDDVRVRCSAGLEDEQPAISEQQRPVPAVSLVDPGADLAFRPLGSFQRVRERQDCLHRLAGGKRTLDESEQVAAITVHRPQPRLQDDWPNVPTTSDRPARPVAISCNGAVIEQ